MVMTDEQGNLLPPVMWRFRTRLQLNALGYENLHADRHQAAIAAFTLAVEQFPASWNAHDSLGEAQLASGLREQAIASYRKSLSLNPANRGAADKLKALGADRRRPSPALGVDCRRFEP